MPVFDNLEEFPLKKINIVRRKLSGGHPCLLLIDEVKHGVAYPPDVAEQVRILSKGFLNITRHELYF